MAAAERPLRSQPRPKRAQKVAGGGGFTLDMGTGEDEHDAAFRRA
jgi:hypothetical protein